MSGWLIKRLRDRRGVAAVEFGLMLPLLMLVLAGVVELGNYLASAQAVEKGLRAGAMFAARSDLPLTATAQTNIETLVKRGSLSGSDPYLTDSWSNGGTVAATASTGTANGQTIDIITVSATVTYEEILPGLMDFFGIGPLKFNLDHAQAWVGN
jgi:Flp pilus assembly protein TadG